jgi:hypothetical protein
MSKRVVKRILDQAGVLSDDKGPDVKVRFNLTIWQEFIDDEVPSLKSAKGTIEFLDPAKGFYFFNSGGSARLRGSNIEAAILITSPTEFTVTGRVTDRSKK